MSIDEPTCTSPQSGFTSSQGSHRFTFIDKTCFQSDCTNLLSQGVPVALLTCVAACFYFCAILRGEWLYLIAFLLWLLKLCMVSSVHWLFDRYPLIWSVYSFSLFKNWLLVYFLLVLYFGYGISVSISLCLLSLTHFVSCLFTFLMLISFDQQKFLIFIKYKLSID